MTDELKPCPFCGGVGHIHKDPDMNWGDFYSVKCSKCRAKSGEFHAAETCPVFYGQVRDAWNTRADLANPLDDPRVKALPKPSVENAYWTVCPKVLEEIRQDAGEWAGEVYLQAVEAIALAVVRRIDVISALEETK